MLNDPQTPQQAFLRLLREGHLQDTAPLKVYDLEEALKTTVQDVRLLSLPPASQDGIWAHRALEGLPPVGCQRLFALFFSALKPRGILFVSTSEYTENDFSSLIRQHGFQRLSMALNPDRLQEMGFLCRRI